MDQYIKNRIIGISSIIIILILFISILNLDYDKCRTDKKIREELREWKEDICYSFGTAFKCETEDLTLFKNYCKKTYGGTFRWNNKENKE